MFLFTASDYPSGIFKLYFLCIELRSGRSRMSTIGRNTTFSDLSREEGGAWL